MLLPPGTVLSAWHLPAGKMRVVCSALGFAPFFSPVFELVPGAEHEAPCELAPLLNRRGRVLNAAGTPRPGARLAPLPLSWIGGDVELSALGQAHVLRNLGAESGSDGSFRIGGVADARTVLLASKPGFAPATLPVAFVADALHELELKLVPGGRLGLELETGDNPLRAGERLNLRWLGSSAAPSRGVAAEAGVFVTEVIANRTAQLALER